MPRRLAISIVAVTLLQLALLSLAKPAEAAPLWSWIPSSFKCNAVGTPSPNSCVSGTGFNPNTSTWGQNTNSKGNCTNYVAFRLARNGAEQLRKIPGDSSNAAAWKKRVTNQFGSKAVNTTPAVGSIAWWGAKDGRGSDGHVAYVERVKGSTIYITESVWKKGSRRLVLKPGSTGFRYPAKFLHIKDMPKTPTATFHQGPMGLLWKATGDIPITGDWDGDGTTDVGVNRGGYFHLRNNSSVHYGLGLSRGDIPITGDWDGDGRTDVGVVRGGHFYLRNADGTGQDIHYGLGIGGGDIPITGDWDGDGRTDVGVVRGGHFYLRNADGTGQDIHYGLGIGGGDIPITGDWDGDGRTDVGVNRGGHFLLRNSTTIHYGLGTTAKLP